MIDMLYLIAFNLFFLMVEYTDDEGNISINSKINGSNFTMELNRVLENIKRKNGNFSPSGVIDGLFDAGVKELGVDPGKALERMERG